MILPPENNPRKEFLPFRDDSPPLISSLPINILSQG